MRKEKASSIASNPLIIKARKDVQDSFLKFQSKPTARNERVWKENKQKIQQAYKELQEKELESMIEKVENADDRSKHGESWNLIDQISGRKKGRQGIVNGKTKEERVSNWFKHFQTLLGKDPGNTEQVEDIEAVLHDMDIEDGNFTVEELKKAKKCLQDGKSAGPDNIPPEVIKNCDLDTILLDFANNLLNTGDKPKQWSEINMIPVPKSGDLSDTSNYRGISLAPIAAKTVNKMVLNRIQPKIDKYL